MVILSNEGLHELVEGGWIVAGSPIELATAPLAAVVRRGTAKPDIGSVAAFKRILTEARCVVMPGSTDGLFIRDVVFPKLGIAETVRSMVLPRGTDSTAALAAGEAGIALGPLSELVNVPGIEVVGAPPDEVQLVQTFTAAILTKSRNMDGASRLTAFLASEQTAAAITKAGMCPA